MKKIIIMLSTLVSLNAFAQVSYLTSSGLKVEVLKTEVINQRSQDIPWDETHRYDVLVQADLKVDVKITDVGCTLEKDSNILLNYQETKSTDDLNERKISFYLAQADAGDVDCTFSSDVERLETITLPLVNGVGAGADKDKLNTFIINDNAGWGNEPVVINVTVNQLKRTIVINN